MSAFIRTEDCSLKDYDEEKPLKNDPDADMILIKGYLLTILLLGTSAH